MKYQFWFRAGMLVLSLAAVVWVRHTLSSRGLSPGFATAVGVNPISARVDLCETRVKRVKTANVEMFEDGMHWMMKKNGVEKQLDPVAVEKWFGANCSVLADDLHPIASSDVEAAAKPVFTIDFIQGGTEAVKQTAAGQFIWKKIAFHSRQLVDALNGLSELREAGPHGRPRP